MATKKSTAQINTDLQIQNLKSKDRRYEVSIKDTPGLFLRVTPAGKKVFVWYTRDDQQKKHTTTIGQYPAASLAYARAKVKDLIKKKIKGTLFDKPEGAPTTVSALADRFFENRISQRSRPDVVRQILDYDVIPVIGTIKLDAIGPLDVNRVIEKMVARKVYAHAGKCLAILKQMFAYAEGLGYIERSPAYAQKPKDLGIIESKPRDRNLSADEIKQLWRALDDRSHRMSDPVRHALKILLLSGVRSNELRLAKWEHIDFDAKTWFIPEENSKTRAWTVPLPDHLIAQFKILEKLSGGAEWAIRGVKSKPITDKVFGRAMKRLFQSGALTIDPATPHDLRRTMRTHLDDLDVEPHIAEKCLNHSLGKINETYNKNPMLDKRMDALQKWGDYVDLIVTERENVLLMEKQA